ncbi:endo alpha-1,4 polygalactosaminidase [candidate division KSB1 bacterium]|nr:endo alpha-1,4 polygalactosaminidase [candidate division KSB1 bacterium]
MKIRVIFAIGMLMFFACAGKKKLSSVNQFDKIENWVCVYSSDAPVDEIKKFDLAVLDSDSHPDLAKLKDSDTLLIGYISIGEVGDYRWYWNDIKDKPWLLDKNPNWDSYMIDVRNHEWQELLNQQIIPKILAKGFDGIFLDTIDNAEYLQRYHPKKKYPMMETAMVRLIKSIRKSFPSAYLVANRGFAILDEIAGSIDAVVAESIFTTIDFEENITRRNTPHEYEPIIKQLRKMKRKEGLKIFTLDYPNLENESDIKEIIADSHALGFIPYISTPQLHKVYSHTLKGSSKRSEPLHPERSRRKRNR